MQRFNGRVESSGLVVTSGLNSTNSADLTFASATITVNIQGGGLATLFSDNIGTPLANPFTANSDATFSFYAANGRYTITATGGGVPTVTLSDVMLFDPVAPQTESSIIIPEGTPTGAAVGFDVLAADATLHAFKTSLNGGGFIPVPQLGGDLSGTAASPTVVSTHITGFTTNAIPKFNASGNLVPSSCTDNGSTVSCSEPYTGVVNASAFQSGVVNGTCVVGEPAGGTIKYANIAAAIADSNCNIIRLPNGYSETLSANLTLKSAMALVADGVANINLGGTNQILIPATVINSHITGIIPWGSTSGGAHNGFSISGYTGTGCMVCVGTSGTQGQSFSMENIFLDNSTGGNGSQALSLVAMAEVRISRVRVAMPNVGTGALGMVLDGDGGVARYTGDVTLDQNVIQGGLAANPTCVRFQNGTNSTLVLGGECSLGSVSGSVGFDITGNTTTGIQFVMPDFNGTVTGISVESTTLYAVYGTIRMESTVTTAVNYGAGTNANHLVNTGSPKVVVDNGSQNSVITPDGFQFNTRFWTYQATPTIWQITGPTPASGIPSQVSMTSGGNVTIDSGANGGAGFIMSAGGVITCSRNSNCTIGSAGSGWPSVFVGPQNSSNLTQVGTNATAARSAKFSDSGGLIFVGQTKRVSGCTTAASAGGNCATPITVTWNTAFADTNYTVACTGNTPTNDPAAPYIVSASKTASAIQVNYFAITAAASSYATVECTAVHD